VTVISGVEDLHSAIVDADNADLAVAALSQSLTLELAEVAAGAPAVGLVAVEPELQADIVCPATTRTKAMPTPWNARVFMSSRILRMDRVITAKLMA
jgi:hypothetical protein